MKMAVVLALEGRWILIDQGQVRAIKPFASLEKATAVVCLSPYSTGEMTLQGDKEHAAALIERREMGSGAIEAESKVFVHHVHPVASAYQAAFSIMKLVTWQQLLGWAQEQEQHCVLLTPTALAWGLVRPGTAVVIQDGVTLTFWAQVAGRIVHASIVAMSTNVEDVRFSSAALGQRLQSMLAEFSGTQAEDEVKALHVQWLSVMRAHDPAGHEEVLAAFRQDAGLSVASADVAYDTRSDLGVIASALPSLAPRGTRKTALGPPGAVFLMQAQRWIPVCVGTILAASVAAILLAGYWFNEASRLTAQAQAIREQVAQKQAAIEGGAQQKFQRADLDAYTAFIASLKRTQSGYDVARAMFAVKQAVSDGMRILSIRSVTESENKSSGAGTAGLADRPVTKAFMVDGMLPNNSKNDGALLSRFIRSLKSSGYSAEAVDVPPSVAALSASNRLFSYRVVVDESRQR